MGCHRHHIFAVGILSVDLHRDTILPNYFKPSARQLSGPLEEKPCSKCHLCTVDKSPTRHLQGPDDADWVLDGAHIILCVVPGTAVSGSGGWLLLFLLAMEV